MVPLNRPIQSEYQDYDASHIAGCDHAGSKAISGPIVGAAVILPHTFYDEMLYTHKKLNTTARIHLYDIIKEHALAWSITMVGHAEINTRGIFSASQLAIYKAIDELNILPNLLLVAGQSFNGYKTVPSQSIPQGEKIYAAINAANILAKVYRDRYMKRLDKDFPAYGWKNNKGYATPAHKQIIEELGPTLYHRKL